MINGRVWTFVIQKFSYHKEEFNQKLMFVSQIVNICSTGNRYWHIICAFKYLSIHCVYWRAWHLFTNYIFISECTYTYISVLNQVNNIFKMSLAILKNSTNPIIKLQDLEVSPQNQNLHNLKYHLNFGGIWF